MRHTPFPRAGVPIYPRSEPSEGKMVIWFDWDCTAETTLLVEMETSTKKSYCNCFQMEKPSANDAFSR